MIVTRSRHANSSFRTPWFRRSLELVELTGGGAADLDRKVCACRQCELGGRGPAPRGSHVVVTAVLLSGRRPRGLSSHWGELENLASFCRHTTKDIAVISYSTRKIEGRWSASCNDIVAEASMDFGTTSLPLSNPLRSRIIWATASCGGSSSPTQTPAQSGQFEREMARSRRDRAGLPPPAPTHPYVTHIAARRLGNPIEGGEGIAFSPVNYVDPRR